MVEHQSKEVIDKIAQDLKIQPAGAVPRELAKQIQLTYDVNPFPKLKAFTGTGANATSTTILTISSNKDTYLVGANLSVTKDAVSDSNFSGLGVTPDDGQANTNILFMRYQPTTAASNLNLSVTFFAPMKLLRGSTVLIIHEASTAAITGTGTIYYYEEDPQ